MKACILIRAEPGESENVVRYARKLEGITQAYPVFGRADVVARAEIRNTAALQTVLDEVNKIEGVTATETLPEVS